MRRTGRPIMMNVGISAALLIVFLIFGSMKSGFHVDEIFTFGLSNHSYLSTYSIAPGVEDGVLYSGEDVWEDYVTIENGSAFDYANVFLNQENDVHPPLYYIIVHTLSSIFPGASIIVLGLMVNIPLAIVCYWQYVWISRKLGLGRPAALILSALYVAGMGFINSAIVFFRMYTLLTVWFNCIMMLFLKYRPKEKGGFIYYICLGLVILAGFLTQYYFLIFALFACLIYAVLVVIAGNWKKLVLSILTVIIAVGIGGGYIPCVDQPYFLQLSGHNSDRERIHRRMD